MSPITVSVIVSWKSKMSVGGALEPLGPEVLARRALDELRGHPDAVAGAAHAALEQIAHAEFARGLTRIDRPALVDEARAARDDREGAEAAERRDQILDHAVGDELLLGIAAEIGEGKNRDRRPDGGAACLTPPVASPATRR